MLPFTSGKIFTAKCEQCGKEFGGLTTAFGADHCPDCRARNSMARDGSIPPEPAPSVPESSAQPSETTAPNIPLSTETVCTIPNAERLGIVSGTCVFGQHVGRDIMSAWRDVTGGRARSAETVFNDARQAALADLASTAMAIGATAVFAVNVNHQELSGGGKSMVMVTATGTAIRINERTNLND